MPIVTEEQYKLILEELFQKGTTLSLTIPKENEKEAEKNADYYLKNKQFKKKTPLTLYFIITKLDDKSKIEFIKEHIDYIRENDEEVFIYDMLSPRALSYFLNIDTIRQLKEIDYSIFKKIVTRNHECLFHGFSHEQYIEFYKEFYNEIIETGNIEFINALYHHNRCCYENMDLNNVNDAYTKQRVYNKEFMNFILTTYKDKIDSFSGEELFRFINYVEDLTLYKELLELNNTKLLKTLETMSTLSLMDYLENTNSIKQEILVKKFYDVIIKQENIKRLVNILSIDIIIDLYRNNKELFVDFKLFDWIKLSARKRILNDELKKIIDSYEIDNIEELFDTTFYITTFYREDTESLRYIERKYRANIKGNVLHNITPTTSIFSKEFLENLTYLKVNEIHKDNPIYLQHLSNFVNFLKNNLIITDTSEKSIIEINKLFNRIIQGNDLAIIYEITSIEEITLLNRIGSIDFKASEFTIEQLEKYNVKNHRYLNSLIKCDNWNKKDYKLYTLKLMLLVGFNNAKNILKINSELPVLEHLVGNVDVKGIKLDSKGNPILNPRIINMLFNGNNIAEMLKNKNNDLYKYFPRIFNEWEMILINDKAKSINTVIDFLKSDDISLPPKYYRLEGLFRYIGCNNRIVAETLNLHDEIGKRVSSSIPRLTGTRDNYSYEVMKLSDYEALAVGNKTDCCFTVLGAGYQCLKHALTSKNGRVFVVKQGDTIIAHSWIWRNGNLLCFDNIEISKSLNEVEFLDIYLNAANEIIKTSCLHEGPKKGITNVTIGFTNFDKKIIGLDNYPCLINESCNLNDKNFGNKLGANRHYLRELPRPLETVNYSDSRNVQYLIAGSGNIESYEPLYEYQDNREETLHYNSNEIYEKEHINKINKIINALRYIKYEQENRLNEYKVIAVEETNEIYCNVDWYIIEFKDGYIETFKYSFDHRSELEINNVEKNKKLSRK